MSLRFDRLAWPCSEPRSSSSERLVSYWNFRQTLDVTIANQRSLTSKYQDSLTLVIDQGLIKNLGEVEEEALVTDLLDGLGRTRFTGVIFDDIQLLKGQTNRKRRSCSRQNARFWRLIDVLGWIPMLTHATLQIGKESTIMAEALTRLPHVTQISMAIEPCATAQAARDLVETLTKPPTVVSKLEITGETRLYSVFVPELLKIHTLDKITFKCADYLGRLQATFPFHMNSVGRFLCGTQKCLPQHVRLMHLNFAAGATHDMFCRGLAEGNIKVLEILSCKVWHAQDIAKALAGSNLQRLIISQLFLEDGEDASTFLAVLGGALPSMKMLETLEANLSFRDRRNKILSVTEQALLALLQGAGSCSSLRGLQISDCPCSLEKLDDGLAECVRMSSSLQTIEVKIGCQNFIEGDGESAQAPYSFPVLLRAIRNNYTLQSLRLKIPTASLEQTKGSMGIDTMQLDSMLRLNRCGRKYMAHDPGNKRHGIDVLSQVSKSLDCLFYHLRENPMLCQRPLKRTLKRRKPVASAIIGDEQPERIAPLVGARKFQRTTRGIRTSPRFSEL